MQNANFLHVLFIYNNCSRIKIDVSRFWFLYIMACLTGIARLQLLFWWFRMYILSFIDLFMFMTYLLFFIRFAELLNILFYTKARSTTALPNSLPLSPATNHLWSAKHQPWLSVYMYIKTIGVYSRILQNVWRSKKYYVYTCKNSHHWYG